MDLLDNQAALILDIDEVGEISVNVASIDQQGLTARICHAIAIKLTSDVSFQTHIMDMIES